MRCIWCNRTDGELKKVRIESSNRFGVAPEPDEFWVHAEHEQAFRTFHQRKERHGRHLLIAVFGAAGALALIVPILMVAGAPRLAVGFCAFVIAGLGIGAIVLPFGTPETVRWLGLRKTITLVRWGGAILILQGIWLFSLVPRLPAP